MKRLTINLPDALAEVLEHIQTREGYRSPTDVVASFVRHWAISQQEHSITGKWASKPGAERDRIDDQLLALVNSGKGKKGSWLKAQIYDAIKQINGAQAKSPTVEQVLSMLPEIVSKNLQKK